MAPLKESGMKGNALLQEVLEELQIIQKELLERLKNMQESRRRKELEARKENIERLIASVQEELYGKKSEPEPKPELMLEEPIFENSFGNFFSDAFSDYIDTFWRGKNSGVQEKEQEKKRRE